MLLFLIRPKGYTYCFGPEGTITKLFYYVNKLSIPERVRTHIHTGDKQARSIY